MDSLKASGLGFGETSEMTSETEVSDVQDV